MIEETDRYVLECHYRDSDDKIHTFTGFAIPKKGTAFYEELLKIIDDNDVLDVALDDIAHIFENGVHYRGENQRLHLGTIYFVLNVNNLFGFDDILWENGTLRKSYWLYSSQPEDIFFLTWILFKNAPYDDLGWKKRVVKWLRRLDETKKYGDGKAQYYYEMLKSAVVCEKGEAQSKGVAEKDAPTEDEIKKMKRRAIKDEIMAMMEWTDVAGNYIIKAKKQWEGVYYVLKADGHYTGTAMEFNNFLNNNLEIDFKDLRVVPPSSKNLSRNLQYGKNISREALKTMSHTDIVDVGLRFAEELDTRLPQKDKKTPSE